MTLGDIVQWYTVTALVCAPFVIWARRFHAICAEYWRKRSRRSDLAKMVAIGIFALVSVVIGPVWIVTVFLREAKEDGFSQ